jgi:hypothetical protein
MDDETCSNTSTLPSIDELSCDSSDFELESFAKSTTQPYQLDSLSRLFTTEW